MERSVKSNIFFNGQFIILKKIFDNTLAPSFLFLLLIKIFLKIQDHHFNEGKNILLFFGGGN